MVFYENVLIFYRFFRYESLLVCVIISIALKRKQVINFLAKIGDKL